MLFGTGLVMSENASNCTQNAAYRDRKLKKNSGKGAQPPPHWEGGYPLPKPPPPLRLDSPAFGARPAAPPLSSFAPHLTLLARGWTAELLVGQAVVTI